MKQTSYLLLFLLTLPLAGISQVQISGKIVSAINNTPIPGASIRVNGTNNATVSSDDGIFSLTLPDSSFTLTVSSMGYRSRELLPPFLSPLIVNMEEDIGQLKTVVVSTGYQKTLQERATGSFTHIDNDLLNRSAGSNILSRLKGVTNGLSFDERRPHNPQVHIRGLSTIYADQSPLIVVNNFPYEGDIGNINPNDVESITILKDAAAASIWGVKAANGVIVITTKQGNLYQPERISFNSSIAITSKPDFDYLPQMSSSDFIQVEKFLFDHGFYTSEETNPDRPPLSPVVDLLIKQRDGLLSENEADKQIESLKNVDVRNDFEKYLYQPAVNQQYLLSLQAGSDKMAYYLSAGYDRSLSNLDEQFNRLSLRANNTFSPTKTIQVHAGIAYVQNKENGGRPGYSNITVGSGKLIYPYAQLADKSGNPLPLVKDYSYPFAHQAPRNGLLNWEYVPLEDYLYTNTTARNREVVLNVGLDVNVTDALTLHGKYQYQHNSGNIQTLHGLESYYTRNMINRFTQVGDNNSFSYPVPMGSILDKLSSELNSQALRGQLSYQKKWKSHKIDAIAGGELRERKDISDNYRTYGYDEYALTSSVVNYLTEHPLYFNPGRNATIPSETSFSNHIDRYTSLYANGAYTYDNRYTISGSVRKDASNLFGVNANQRGIPLWSAGLSWNIHNESFYNSSWMEHIKLRLTYGYNGNLDENTTAITTLTQLTDHRTNRPYTRIRTYPNPDLSWEKVKMVNLGLDFSIKENALSGSIEYYIKEGLDLLGDAPIDPTIGLISGKIRRNIASIKGQGIDVEITSANINRSLKWHTTLIFNYNTNKVNDLDSVSTHGSYYVNSGLTIIPIKGKPLYNVFSYQWKGLDHETGDPIGVFNNQPTTDYRAIVNETPVNDLRFHGPALPTIVGALRNIFAYKGFTLSANLIYRFGYYFQRSSISYSNLFTAWSGHRDFADRWRNSGDETHTNIPSMVYPNNGRRDEFYRNSAALVEKGDHIRLQDINISYIFSRERWTWLPLEKLRVFLNAQNLGILWRANSHNLDPDYATGFLPPSFTLSFGLQTNF